MPDESHDLRYSHTANSKDEHITRHNYNFKEYTNSHEEVTLSFGCCLAKIIEYTPLLDQYDYDKFTLKDMYDIEARIAADLKQDGLFELFPLIGRLFGVESFERSGRVADKILPNIKNFVELCCQDSKYCTLEMLTAFASLILYPLKGPDKLLFIKKAQFDRIETEEMRMCLDEILNQEEKGVINNYTIVSINDLCFASLYEIFSENRIIRRCESCGKVFIPPNRTDTKYCTNKSPRYENLTCKEAMKYIKQQERLNGNDLERLHKVAYNTIRNRLNSKKAVENADVCAFYEKHLQDFKEESKKRRQLVLSGEIPKEDYKKWLNEAKRKKV